MHTITETILALETNALTAWLDGDPTPYLELYARDFTYFDSTHEMRIDGFDKIKALYESIRGTIKIAPFQIINPIVQATDTMAVLSYDLHAWQGEILWKEHCTEVYRLESDNTWKIVHNHWSMAK